MLRLDIAGQSDTCPSCATKPISGSVRFSDTPGAGNYELKYLRRGRTLARVPVTFQAIPTTNIQMWEIKAIAPNAVASVSSPAAAGPPPAGCRRVWRMTSGINEFSSNFTAAQWITTGDAATGVSYEKLTNPDTAYSVPGAACPINPSILEWVGDGGSDLFFFEVSGHVDPSGGIIEVGSNLRLDPANVGKPFTFSRPSHVGQMRVGKTNIHVSYLSNLGGRITSTGTMNFTYRYEPYVPTVTTCTLNDAQINQAFLNQGKPKPTGYLFWIPTPPNDCNNPTAILLVNPSTGALVDGQLNTDGSVRYNIANNPLLPADVEAAPKTTQPAGQSGLGNPALATTSYSVPSAPVGQRLTDSLATIKVLGNGVCLAEPSGGSWQLQPDDGTGNNCTLVMPELVAGGYQLVNGFDQSKCLEPNISDQLVWVDCFSGKAWSDLDPSPGQQRYPDSSNRFPLFIGQKCLTRASDSQGASVYMSSCGDVGALQLWTDPKWMVVRTADAFDTQNLDPKDVKIPNPGTAYDYSPSVVNNRIFWCAGIGSDAIVSMPLNPSPGKYPIKPGQAYMFGEVSPDVANMSPGENEWGIRKKNNPSAVARYLTCDPFAVKTSTGYDVYFTRGVEGTGAKGAFNDVWLIKTDANGTFTTKGRNGVTTVNKPTKVDLGNSECRRPIGNVSPTTYKTLTPAQLAAMDYGCGQPSVVTVAGKQLLNFRVPGPTGDISKTVDLAATSPRPHLTFGNTPNAANPDEDYGGSQEVFRTASAPTNTFYKLTGSGGGITVGRQYTFSCTPAAGGYQITRQITATWACPAPAVCGTVNTTDGLNGELGVVRGPDNLATVSTGTVKYWGGTVARELLKEGSITVP